MKLSHISICVRDMESTITFYRGLAELVVLRRYNPGQSEIAILADREGDTALELLQPAEAEPVRAAGLSLCFRARTSLEALRERAFAMGYAPTPIQSQAPGPASFTVTDPNGLRVEFRK